MGRPGRPKGAGLYKLEKGELHKTTHYIMPGQDAFLKRKVAELQKRVPQNRREEITESTVLQGLLHIWMALEQEPERTP